MYGTGYWALAYAIAGIVIPVGTFLYIYVWKKDDMGRGMAWGFFLGSVNLLVSLILEIVAVILGYRALSTAPGHHAFWIGIDTGLVSGGLTALNVYIVVRPQWDRAKADKRDRGRGRR